ncbi:MAG: DUF4124 domain-containing protein [Pseudomonadota bacterium]
MSKQLLCSCLIWIFACAVHAQVYRSVDENGNVIFTDSPPADAQSTEAVELPPTNTVAPPPNVPSYQPPATEAEPAQRNYQVSIAQPANETTIPMGPGNFAVTAQVEPNLAGDHRLQLTMDGAPWGEPQSSGSWSLTNVFRGEHTLAVNVLDQNGNTVATSSGVTVYVLRPSINSPARANRAP